MKTLRNIDHRIGRICDSNSILPSHNPKYCSNWKTEKTTKQQIENKSIISAIQTAAAQSNQEESTFTVGPCSPTTSYPTQFFVSPNYEEPELSMTVGEAERYYESESD